MNTKQIRIISKYHGAIPTQRRELTLKELRLARFLRRFEKLTK